MLVFSNGNDIGYGDNGDGDKDENISFHHDDEEDNDNEYEEDDGDDKEDVDDDGNDGGLPMIKVNSCPFLASEVGAAFAIQLISIQVLPWQSWSPLY